MHDVYEDSMVVWLDMLQGDTSAFASITCGWSLGFWSVIGFLFNAFNVIFMLSEDACCICRIKDYALASSKVLAEESWHDPKLQKAPRFAVNSSFVPRKE